MNLYVGVTVDRIKIERRTGIAEIPIEGTGGLKDEEKIIALD